MWNAVRVSVCKYRIARFIVRKLLYCRVSVLGNRSIQRGWNCGHKCSISRMILYETFSKCPTFSISEPVILTWIISWIKPIPVIMLYSRLRTGIPRRSKLLHCRSRWWKQATHTTARPSKSNLAFDPSNSARTGKKGPFGCSVAKSFLSNPFVELLQNVHNENTVSPFVVECSSDFATLAIIHIQISCFWNLHTKVCFSLTQSSPIYHTLNALKCPWSYIS